MTRKKIPGEAREKNVQRFNADVNANDGYVYTYGAQLSAVMSNSYLSARVARLVDFRGKRVLDMGCGDGIYTAEFLALGAAEVVGVDAASSAILNARKRYRSQKRLKFEVLDVYNAKPPKKRFDIMVVRGFLHHLYDVEKAIAALSPLAKTIIVVEPNGYNPVLKIIEKSSRYHVEHEEKSYPPHRIDAWFGRHGAKVKAFTYVGLVPFFCPDWAARLLKVMEPLVESVPGLRQIACGQYVLTMEMP